MTTAQLTRTTPRRAALADTLSVWRTVRGMWKKNRTNPLKYQRAIRKERAF